MRQQTTATPSRQEHSPHLLQDAANDVQCAQQGQQHRRGLHQQLVVHAQQVRGELAVPLGRARHGVQQHLAGQGGSMSGHKQAKKCA